MFSKLGYQTKVKDDIIIYRRAQPGGVPTRPASGCWRSSSSRWSCRPDDSRRRRRRPWRQLYKNRSSRKIDSLRIFTRERDFPKTFSLTENQFSGKTYFYTIGPWVSPADPTSLILRSACRTGLRTTEVSLSSSFSSTLASSPKLNTVFS